MSITATHSEEHWVVEVVDGRDVERNMPGYKQRFTFYGEDAAQRAWTCQADAIKAGFSSTTERVRKV